MATLTLDAAQKLVRKNLDEIDPNGSIMYTDENGSSSDYADNKSMDDIIAKSLPEAINAINLAAPVTMLDGESVTPTVTVLTNTPSGNAGKVLNIALASTDKFLRLVAFKASDSDIVVTDAIEEASAEGRKQANKYICGQYDRPRLIHVQGSYGAPVFKYYSLKSTTDTSDSTAIGNAVSNILIVKKQEYAAVTTSYTISEQLRQNIIDYLTGMVLEIYSDQRAQNFFQRAINFQ